MGRPRKPTKLHAIEGTRPGATNRDRSNEPKDLPPLGDWPEHWHSLDPDLRTELVATWHEIKGRIPEGVLTDADRFTLEVVVGLLHSWRTGRDKTGKRLGFGGLNSADLGTLKAMLGLMGMTPADRSRVSAAPKPGGESSDPWDSI